MADNNDRDLATCDREPIHSPGAIQPHGFLLAAPVATGVISHASENTISAIGRPAGEILGQRWSDCLGSEISVLLESAKADPGFALRPIRLKARWAAAETAPGYQLIAHRRAGFVILEGEEILPGQGASTEETQLSLEPLLARMSGSDSAEALYTIATDQLRRITGFDRVLLYRFDEDWNGSVIAESRNDQLPAYLGHRFPASDIPKPARDLYLVNHLRMIARADYVPVGILAREANLPPLDLSLSTLRSVSPIHLEYMRNMGTGCSMSVALRREGRLWGLLSCHGREARRLSFATRTIYGLLADILSLQLQSTEQAGELGRRVELRAALSRLVTRMTQADDFVEAFEPDGLLGLTEASGAVLVRGEDEVKAFGRTPLPVWCLQFREWVSSRCRDGLFMTDALPSLYPPAGGQEDGPGGLLAISISPAQHCYLFWFREELVQTVLWGGDPHKTASPAGDGLRMHPRKSFETWKETVRGRSRPWQVPEREVALGLRGALIDIVLRKTAEKARLIEELKRVNHELETFTYTVSHDLRAPFRHVRGYAELLQLEKSEQLDEEGRLFVHKILHAAGYAGELVDSMLAFSRMSMKQLELQPVNLDDLMAHCREAAMALARDRRVEWQVARLPVVSADPSLIQSAVQNLLDNAVKYTATRPVAHITVDLQESADSWIVSVADNGAGFDMAYANKLFGIFQRLHAPEAFPGLGIGLASVRRIIDRMGGRVWAEGVPDVGATFYFSLPRNPAPAADSTHAQADPSRRG